MDRGMDALTTGFFVAPLLRMTASGAKSTCHPEATPKDPVDRGMKPPNTGFFGASILRMTEGCSKVPVILSEAKDPVKRGTVL